MRRKQKEAFWEGRRDIRNIAELLLSATAIKNVNNLVISL